MKKITGAIGWTLTLIGMGCMDNINSAVPVVMIFAGLMIFVLSMKGENYDTV